MSLSPSIPPPPKGIILDDDAMGMVPPPPKGITLDADTAMPVTMSQRRPSWSGTMPQAPPSMLDALTAAHRGGTVQAYTEEPTTGPLNPLVGAVTAAKGAKEVMTSGAVPPPAAHGPAAALPTDEQRRQAMKGTSDILSGAMSATAPFVLPGAMETPAAALRTGVGIAAGTATGEAAGYGAKKAGLSPEAQELAKTAGFFIPSAVGVGMGRAYEATPNGPKDVFHSLVHNYSGQVLPEEPTLEQANAAFRATMNNLHPDVNASHVEDAKNLNQAWSLYKQTLAPTPPPPMPRQPGEPPLGLPGEAPPMHSITAEEIAEIGDKIAKLPVEERPQATLAAHTALATELLNQGKLTIDGELHQVKNQNQADKLAQKLINEEIGRQDAQAKKSANEPVPAPPPGITLDEAPKAGESKAEEAPAFQKGDRVTLPKGDTGTVAHINSRLIRVTLDSGGKASVPVENWSKVQKVEAPTPPPAEAAVEEKAKADVAAGSVIFARHGATKLDQAGGNETVAGWSNEPLDERGKAAANQLAQDVKAEKPTVIVSSDLPRAKETADIVGQELGIPVRTDERLRPQRIPETEGKQVKEIQSVRDDLKEHPDKVPAGGESYNQAEARQDGALQEVEDLVAKGEKPIVVTHSTNLEMELGQKPEPGGFITQGGRAEGGAVEPSKPAVERRSNLAERKRVEHMTPEEMKRELLVSHVVDLPNRRAFDEAEHTPAKAVAMSDADGLKALNDKFGYEAGNALLKAKAEALKEAGLDAYHEKGDEFLYRGASPEELSSKLEKAREILRNRPIDFRDKETGQVRRFQGADFSYGSGKDLADAESGLKSHKSEREARGERARGELRGITEARPEEVGVRPSPVPAGSSQVELERPAAGRAEEVAPAPGSPEYEALKAKVAALEPRQPSWKSKPAVPTKQPWELSPEERKAEVAHLKKENASILSTPLMSEGEIAPAQVGAMSKRQHFTWQTNAQKRMAIKSQIKTLESDERIARAKEAHDKEIVEQREREPYHWTKEEWIAKRLSDKPQSLSHLSDKEFAKFEGKRWEKSVAAAQKAGKLSESKPAVAEGAKATDKSNPEFGQAKRELYPDKADLSDAEVMKVIDRAEEIRKETKPATKTPSYQEWVAGGRKGLGPAGVTKEQDLLGDWFDKLKAGIPGGRGRTIDQIPKAILKTMYEMAPQDRPISLLPGELSRMHDRLGLPTPSLEERALKEGAQPVKPLEEVPKAGKNFEGRYVQAALEPAQEAWAKTQEKYADHTISWGKDTESRRRDGVRVNMHDPQGNWVAGLDVKDRGSDKVQVIAPGSITDSKYGQSAYQVLDTVSDWSTAKKIAEGRLRSGQVYNPDGGWEPTSGVHTEFESSKMRPLSQIKPDAAKPKGFKQDKLLVKVPDDGTFVIPNNPVAIQGAMKRAGDFESSKVGEALRTEPQRTPKSPAEFNVEKYIAGLEREIADLNDRLKKTPEMQKPYIEEQLKAARENLADAKRQTPETLANRSSERGSSTLAASPAGLVIEAAQTAAKYLHEVKHSTKIARDLQRGLQTLDTQAQADILRGKDTFEKLQKEGLSKADDAAIYHHLEDPEGSPLDKKQDGFLDEVALPIDEQNTELYKELKDGGVPIENYVHRSVKGKGGMLDRIMEGAKAPAKKGTLSKSAPQTKHRTMMAIESPSGERRVVSIKDGKATMWQDGNATDLGEIKNAKGRSKVENDTFPNGEPNSIFYDQGKIVEGPDGYDWKVTQATTKEVETATPVRYYHSAFASLIASNIQLSRAVRAMRFLEDFKGSDEFQEIAYKGANPPKDWKTTTLPQFPNYYFEPRTAEVLDDYAERLKGGDFGVLQTAQKFLRAAYLINPIVHPLNVAASWAFEKGLTGFAPWKWKTIYKTGNKAVKAVLTQNDDFKAALDAGAAGQSHRDALQDIHKLFFDRLAEGLDKKESWAMQVAKALGIEHGNLLNLLHKPSSIAAWNSSDILYLQAAYQYQAEHPGVSLNDALKEAGRIIPEYRVPTRILDSRMLSKGMTNPLVSWFGAYHYGLLKSFAEAAKSALGAQEPTPGRSKVEEVGKGWDRLALLGLMTMALFPFVFDKEAKKVTGDEHAKVRRPGPFGYVDAAQQVLEHKQDASSAFQKVVTPSPITKTGVELAFNRELFSGHEIYDPHADWNTQSEQIGRYLLGNFGPYGQYERTQTSEQKRKFLWQQAGIQMGKTRAEKLAGDIASSKVGTAAESPEDEENRVERREILEQLRKGNAKPFEEARSKHQLTHRQILNLERRARLSPLEDMVHNFTLGETQRVLDAAKADKDQKEIELMERILRQKRARAHAWQTPVAVGQ